MTPTSALVPAAARDTTALSDVEAVLNEQAVEVFAKAVGGRDRLADTLAVAGTGTDIERITTLLLDPRYAAHGLGRICQMTGITVAELFASYKKALIARAHIEACHIIAAKLPPVVDDVMNKALSDPTVERHKLALEVGQLLEKKGGLIVQQNNLAQTVGATGPGSLEQLQQAVGDLLFGERRPVEPVEPPEVVEADPRVESPAPNEGNDEPPPDEEQPELPFDPPVSRPPYPATPPGRTPAET